MSAPGDLCTERQRAGRDDLDRLPTERLVALMHEEDGAVHAAVGDALPAIAATVDAIAARLAAGGRLIYVGAGTSGRLAVLDASECGPTFAAADGRVVGVIAGGDAALSRAVEGAEDDGPAGARALASLGAGPLDVVVGISASGRTPYVVEAIRHAVHCGAATAAVVCNPASALGALVDHAIEVVVGPEFIAGSTRLKAGTAQKLVLNMLSTLTMVRLGRTFGNLMVDAPLTNAKLRGRAVRIVAAAGGVEHARAEQTLDAAGADVKVAIAMLRLGVSVEAARECLRRAGGDLRRALEGPACV